jgi:dTDP-glucose 4,6-dehydratase
VVVRILVTGASGFVGSYLCDELAEHEVHASDVTDHDLAVPGQATRLLDLAQPEYVVHLAARYGRLLCRDEPHKAVSDNTAATTELAAVCAERGIPVLYTSTSEVYGDHGQDTITEESELRTPTTIYGLSKRWGEEALNLYLRPENLTIVRLNMLYGPDQRAGYGCCALATFIKKALAGEPFTVHRNTSRSYLYISDAVKALRLLIEGGHTGTYNLSNDREFAETEALAGMVCAAVPSIPVLEPTERYILTDPPSIQIPRKNYSSAKLRETIDWLPEVALPDGIQNTVDAQRANPVDGYTTERT